MKISITIDTELHSALHRLAEMDPALSMAISDAVRGEAKRLQMITLLEEMERENPISDMGGKRVRRCMHA
jgi:hypothetical protein